MSIHNVLSFRDNYREYLREDNTIKMTSMENLSIFARRLKKERDALGLSQDGLAALVRQRGVKAQQSHIGNLENNPGERLPSLPLLVALAQELGTSTDYLLGLTDNPLPAVSFDESPLDSADTAGEFERMYYRLSEIRRRELLMIGHLLADIDRETESAERDISWFVDLFNRLQARGLHDVAIELLDSAPGPLRGRLRVDSNGSTIDEQKAREQT